MRTKSIKTDVSRREIQRKPFPHLSGSVPSNMALNIFRNSTTPWSGQLKDDGADTRTKTHEKGLVPKTTMIDPIKNVM
jgi:hypothetical protein